MEEYEVDWSDVGVLGRACHHAGQLNPALLHNHLEHAHKRMLKRVERLHVVDVAEGILADQREGNQEEQRHH